jgi:hypothetical protein
VWRFERERCGACELCLRVTTGFFVEGEVVDNALTAPRLVCAECYRRFAGLVVGDELGDRAQAPAYAHTR